MMEMDSNPITKPSKKGTILSAVFYALAVVLLITAFVSLAACYQNISRQLEQGVPAQGNELAIVNLYLTSCVQYFAFAAAMVFCGKAAAKVLAIQSEAPVQITPYIDFKKKTITIRHTVTQVTLNGKSTIIEKDRTKTKSSYRTLPLVPPFEELLHRLKLQQEQNRKLCGKSYNTEAEGYKFETL